MSSASKATQHEKKKKKKVITFNISDVQHFWENRVWPGTIYKQKVWHNAVLHV